ncbi:hypothetical protein ACFL9S_12505 [Erwinia sp. AnSW2-5]|uniref:hypothetical protein n=1 Tax=Erwinia sp. AnSW2-5 TaxID=3367692 RepID=UPI00385BB03A
MDTTVNRQSEMGRAGIITHENLRELIGNELYNETLEYTLRQTGLGRTEAEQQVIECLRFLYLISAFPQRLGGLFLPVEQAIDEVWHFLILQTREYRILCEQKLPGRFFIEHRSMPYNQYGQEPGREQMAEEALRWLPLYRATFGGFDECSAPCWTMVRFLHGQMNMSLEHINALNGEMDE